MNKTKINHTYYCGKNSKNVEILNYNQVKKKIADFKIKELIRMAGEQAKNFIKQNDYIPAEILLEQALKVKYDLKLKQHLVIVKMYLRKYEESAKLCKENIKTHRLAEDYNNLALIQRAQLDFKSALKNGRMAYKKNPKSAAIIANYAVTAVALNNFSFALELIEEAIKRDGKNPMMYANKASMLSQIGKLVQAERVFKQALALNPQEPQVFIDYFYCLANQKKYSEAWPYYENRYYRIKELRESIAKYKKPVITYRKPFYHERICILPEQGLGDTLMSLRFIEEFQKIAPNSYFYSSEQIYAFAKKLPIKIKEKFDKKTTHIVGIMSLPFLLGIEKIPEPKTPVKHSPEKNGKLRIGLCWAGSPHHPLDSLRSTYLKFYEKFLNDPHIQAYSFMKDRRMRIYAGHDQYVDYAEGFENYKIIDLSDHMTNSLETAKLFDQIDILITCDTFVAHLAGTCGVPTYVLIGDKPDWRWGQRDAFTEWYPTVKLIRKRKNESFLSLINSLYKKIRGKD
jgi:tetratricopeptide (TPR) repeat protein